MMWRWRLDPSRLSCAWGIAIAAIAALAVVASAAPVCAEPSDLWRLDPDHTDIQFSWDHLGVSRQSGTVNDVSGRLRFNPTKPIGAELEVSILVESLNTGVAALDDMLKSADYFDAARFPRIAFTSTGVRQTGERSADVTGMLTIRDQSHPVVLQTTWNFTGEHPLGSYNPVYRGQWLSGFTATATIARSQWGISRAAPLVSDAIELVLNAEFVRID